MHVQRVPAQDGASNLLAVRNTDSLPINAIGTSIVCAISGLLKTLGLRQVDGNDFFIFHLEIKALKLIDFVSK